jgi:hypothetical protein
MGKEADNEGSESKMEATAQLCHHPTHIIEGGGRERGRGGGKTLFSHTRRFPLLPCCDDATAISTTRNELHG